MCLKKYPKLITEVKTLLKYAVIDNKMANSPLWVLLYVLIYVLEDFKF